MVLVVLGGGPGVGESGVPVLGEGVEVVDVGFAEVLRGPVFLAFYIEIEEVGEVGGGEGLVGEEGEGMVRGGPFFAGLAVLEAGDGAACRVDA